MCLWVTVWCRNSDVINIINNRLKVEAAKKKDKKEAFCILNWIRCTHSWRYTEDSQRFGSKSTNEQKNTGASFRPSLPDMWLIVILHAVTCTQSGAHDVSVLLLSVVCSFHVSSIYLNNSTWWILKETDVRVHVPECNILTLLNVRRLQNSLHYDDDYLQCCGWLQPWPGLSCKMGL